MKSNTALTMIFTVIVASVLVGQIYIYTFNGGYSSSVERNGDTIGTV
jgi:hypothetical protein